MRTTFSQLLRRDAILIAGVALAGVAAFNPTLQRAFDWVKDVEAQRHVALVPGLTVLFAALVLHQLQRRHQARTAAAEAAAEVRAMRLRTDELERLVSLEHAVAASLDLLSLKHSIESHLPGLCGLRDCWVMLRLQGRWEAVVLRRTSDGGPLKYAHLERLAADTLARTAPDEGARSAVNVVTLDGHLCLPLRVGGVGVGVLGVLVRELPVTDTEQHTLEAAAGVLAIGAKNVELVGEIRDNGIRDALTGCFNRAHAMEALRVELRRAQRAQSPLSVVMLDLDRFKDINDQYGHLAGDAVLASTGRLLREVLRGSDAKCRYGGEEFLLILPDTASDAARVVAEMLRGVLARTPVAFGGRSHQVTGSFGVTTATGGEVDEKSVVARADAALYQAKRAGRNCVRVAHADAPADGIDAEALRAELGTRRSALH